GQLYVLSDLMCNSSLSFRKINEAEHLIKRKLRDKKLGIHRPKEVGLSLSIVDDSDEETLVEAYYYKINEILDAFADSGTESFQLLVLVRGRADRRRCIISLERIEQDRKVTFLDLTDDKNKRHSPRADQIRLCTYESSRGLEAEVVLLMSFEHLL